MNLVESIKHVLKTKHKNIFSSFWKEDIKGILKDIVSDVVQFSKNKKGLGLRNTFVTAKTTLQDSLLILKVVPQRVNEGFKFFGQELMEELDKLPDPKQKTKFCMKVLAGLSKFAVSSAYGLGLGDNKLLGYARIKSTYSHIVMARLIFRLSQGLILRFVEEIEKEIQDPEERKHLESFRNIVLDDSGNAIDKFFEGVIDPNDPAFAIVDNFKKYLFTGERS